MRCCKSTKYFVSGNPFPGQSKNNFRNKRKYFWQLKNKLYLCGVERFNDRPGGVPGTIKDKENGNIRNSKANQNGLFY